MIGLHTQAAQATFADQGNDPDHLSAPLASGTIRQLLDRQAAVQKVQQPYASFDGKPQEAATPFYTRVSERLRHRQRSLSAWDYERLVLEKFPDIFQVRCLPHTSPQALVDPGAATLIVVPNLRNQQATTLLMPRASVATLDRIRTYLQEYLSPFANLHVQNPQYEEVLLDFKVRFREGNDEGYYVTQLNEELRRYLSPWAYQANQEVVFGGRIYKSKVLAFIENRPYVDYVLDFKLYHLVPEGIGKL
ncbi:MAG TPA: hypothetical protein DCR93_37105, partial [Cytophagales bacterium]|nr:hypothetical protein [Cytophagales bacterium]